jgi:hypothetical protein
MRHALVVLLGSGFALGMLPGCPLTNEERGEDAVSIDAGDSGNPSDIGVPDVEDTGETDAIDAGGMCSPERCGPAPGSDRRCPDGNGSYVWECLPNDSGGCSWTETGCEDDGCYSNANCDEGEYCTASTECLADPSCPGCDVCWGHCLPNECSQPECGLRPQPACIECTDGSVVCPACVRDEEGVCDWVVGECVPPNPECTEQECGPAPGAPCQECADGTFACPTCARSADGVCGWTFPQCPPEGCHSDEECPDGHYCTAPTECLPDPSCPDCDVCWGTCQWLPD